MGGKTMAIDKLNSQFSQAEKFGFTSGSSHDKELHPEYRSIPINYGNQPSIQTAFIFNKLNRPDLTQYWSRKVIDNVFSGLSPATGYNGDEDQGLMGSLAVLMKLGIFQMNGGTEEDPKYELSSPLFAKTVLFLPNGNKLQINVDRNSPDAFYVQSLEFNGKAMPELFLNHSDVVKGGVLEYSLSTVSKE
jgi:putative alpha-1,2-mannosidase